MKNINKVNVVPVSWKHHLEGGGWEWVCSQIMRKFHDPKKRIKMYMAYEYQARDKIFEPHIAWFHQVLEGPERCLENIVKSRFWENNMKYLIYAITVSKHQEDFLRKHGVKNITTISHPTSLDVGTWNVDKFTELKNVYHIGFHCRNINNYKRVVKKYRGELQFNYLVPKQDLKIQLPNDINVVPRVRSTSYEKILAESVVYMNLTDATANNTVLECIARGTPVIVNPVGGVKEYLGDKYPLLTGTP